MSDCAELCSYSGCFSFDKENRDCFYGHAKLISTFKSILYIFVPYFVLNVFIEMCLWRF